MDHRHEISEEERVSRLAIRLAELKTQGARIEQTTRFGAIVLHATRAHVLPNLTMILAGLALFAMTHEPLFGLAAAVSALGWHKKVLAAANPRRLWIRVDELGRVRESELTA